jgi:predicted GNAT family N-acyltransferase
MTPADTQHDLLRIDRAGPDDLAHCLELRRQVFVVEQGVPLELECDGQDEDCAHLIARLGDRVAGTARLRAVAGGAKAERVAVPAELRGRGLGRALMRALEALARERGHARLSLHAQESAVPFYLDLDYVPEGAPFEEAGIPHQGMSKQLD